MLATRLADEAARHAFQVTGPQLVVGLVAVVVTLVSILVHYEVMSVSTRLISRFQRVRRARIVLLILAFLVAHSIEVWCFGIAYNVLDHWPRYGQLLGDLDEGLLDFVYFSVVTYTTLGFGDIVPDGPVRILCGAEALVGLTLITWSASLAFLEMQRDWAEFRRVERRSSTPRS